MDISTLQIVPSWGNGTSPARSLRSTGRVDINQSYIPIIAKMYKPRDVWEYILQHERGHIVKDTTDEMLADQYASDEYFKLKLSPKASVIALSGILNINQPSQLKRVIAQYLRAAKHDCEVNGNNTMCNQYQTIIKKVPDNISNYVGTPAPTGYTNFSLFGKEIICGPICEEKKRKAAAAKRAAAALEATLKKKQEYDAQRLALEAQTAAEISKQQTAQAKTESQSFTVIIIVVAAAGALFFIARKKGWI